MNWKRALIATVAAAPVIALFAFGFTRNPAEIPSPLPGSEAPHFALEVFAPGEEPIARAVGDTIDLGELAGKVTVINFWASWCLACRDEHTDLSETALHYGDRAQFIGVLYNDRAPNALRWIANMGGQSYPSVLDDGSQTAISYGLYGVPESFIIGTDGLIAHKQIGPIRASTLRSKIDSLLNAVPSGNAGAAPVSSGAPPPATTEAQSAPVPGSRTAPPE